MIEAAVGKSAWPGAAFVLPHRGWLFDLDGTVYLGDALIPGADGDHRRPARGGPPGGLSLQQAAAVPRRLRPDAHPARHSGRDRRRHQFLGGAGPPPRAPRSRGAPVFVIGEPSLVGELQAAGFETRSDPHVRWVVISFDRTFDYAKLNTALQAVTRHGARLIATNPDRTCPVDGGEIPDCAGMIAAVEAVTDHRVEIVVGKPSPIILEEALAVARAPRARVRHRGRSPGDGHPDGQAPGPGHHPRAQRRHAARRPAHRRGGPGPRATIDPRRGGR